MTLQVEEIVDGVFHVVAETQYDLTSTFMRVQEFYESPFPEIRGHFFTHEQYMNTCARGSNRSGSEEIKFSYFEDWAGFNVPGNIFNKWVRLFSKKGLWEKEQTLVDLIYEQLEKKTSKFYVIGTYADGESKTINHELSHAWFYLDPEYKKATLKLVRKLPTTAKQQLKRYLKKDGYTPEVFDDEIVAYLSTSPMTSTAKQFGDETIPWDNVLEFQETFEKFKEEKIDEDN